MTGPWRSSPSSSRVPVLATVAGLPRGRSLWLKRTAVGRVACSRGRRQARRRAPRRLGRLQPLQWKTLCPPAWPRAPSLATKGLQPLCTRRVRGRVDLTAGSTAGRIWKGPAGTLGLGEKVRRWPAGSTHAQRGRGGGSPCSTGSEQNCPGHVGGPARSQGLRPPSCRSFLWQQAAHGGGRKWLPRTNEWEPSRCRWLQPGDNAAWRLESEKWLSRGVPFASLPLT